MNKLFLSLFVLVSLFLGNSLKSNENQNPSVIVIFGATGDLTVRKLVPAVYNLVLEKHLTQTAVVGFARRAYTHAFFRKQMADGINQFSRNKPINADVWKDFETKIFYNQSEFEADQGYEDLNKLMQQIDKDFGTAATRIYYLSTHPKYFSVILEKLHKHHMLADHKVILEKPFGSDLDSAHLLQQSLAQYLKEDQVYRMDHYLGKQAVQNLLTLRFESGIFEPLWNNTHIDNIQITIAEDIGVGTRGKLWEDTGIVRDIFQNHLLQLLALVTMDKPAELTTQQIHAEKLKLINAIHLGPKDIIPGQYGPGNNAIGYRQENDVSPTSNTETFAAAKFTIDNDRWRGVPFYLRAGKRLAKQSTEIVITFKNSPNALFIRIQPNPSVYLRTLSKVPGIESNIQPVLFGYGLESTFGKPSPEAYEKLIYDAIQGDHSLYVQLEEQLAAWKLLTPILDSWKKPAFQKFPNYEAGSWGPQEANELLEVNGHKWEILEK